MNFCIFFETFAALEEHDETLECALADIEVVLKHMLNGRAKENWVLLINSDLRDHLDKLAWDILWLLVQDDVLQDLTCENPEYLDVRKLNLGIQTKGEILL